MKNKIGKDEISEELGSQQISHKHRTDTRVELNTYQHKIQLYTNKSTKAQYKVFTIKTFGLHHVSTLSCGSASRSVHEYLYKMYIINR